MSPFISIQFIPRSKLNIQKWDKCIEESDNGVIYAKSYFLDTMSDKWGALILNDYEAVMPLPWRKKWGIRYVYQIAFTQKLGIFGKQLSDETNRKFSANAANIFRFLDYSMDSKIQFLQSSLHNCTNFILPLIDPYTKLYGNFSSECKKNIRKAAKRGCVLIENIDSHTTVEMYKNIYAQLHQHITENDYKKIQNLIDLGKKNGFCNTYGVTDLGGEIVFSAAIFNDNKRLYYILGSPSSKGRELRATYFFIDKLIKKYSGSKLILDFEGSDIINVANFYKRFNPEIENYYTYRINNLPWPFNYFKK